MTALTDTGFVVTRTDERLTGLQTQMKGIFGDDISVGSDTMDGELLGILAESDNALGELGKASYEAHDPAAATGVGLSQLVRLNGIKRTAGRYSTINISFYCDANANIPAGVQLTNGNDPTVWVTTAAIVGNGGAVVTVPCQTQTMGVTSTPDDSQGWNITTPKYLLNGVASSSDFVSGRAEETDAELRARREKSTAITSQGLPESLASSLNSTDYVPNVRQAKVYENFTGSAAVSTDNPYGIAAHSIECIIWDDAVTSDPTADENKAIAQTIWEKKGMGCGLVGSTTGTATDLLAHTHTMYWTAPAPQEIYVSMTGINRGAADTWETDVKNAIVDWANSNLGIGDKVYVADVVAAVMTVPGIAVEPSSFLMGVGAATANADIAIAYDQVAHFDAAHIAITSAQPTV
jgi:uncharacterized phage protein gp47/JayE